MRKSVLSMAATVAALGLMVVGAPSAWAAPANDNYADAIDLGMTDATSAGADVTTATIEAGETLGGSHSVWYRWTAPYSGLLHYNTCDTDFDNVVMWFENAGPTIPTSDQITFYSDDNPGCGPAPFGGSIRMLPVTLGMTYTIRVSGFGSASGSFVLSFNLEKDNTPPPVYEAIAKSGACDTENGWAESWQHWVNAGAGGAVCERTLVYLVGQGNWFVARYDVAEGKYVPIYGAQVGKGSSVGGAADKMAFK